MKLLRIIFINGVVLLVLNVFILVCLEVYLRSTIPESSREPIFEWTLENTRHKVMKKNTRSIAWGEELRTNKLGFRDNREEVPAKAANGFRVIVLGDSFTISGGVEYEKIYSSLLEDKLQMKNPDVDVVNLAVGGYNPVQYQAVLEEVGLALDPDLVLVGVFPSNDFDRGRAATQDLNYRRAAFGEDMPQEVSGFRSFYVYRAFLWRIETRLTQLLTRFSKPENNSTKDASGWPDNLEALKVMSEIAHKNNIKFQIAILPHNWDYFEHRKVVERVMEYCKAQGLPCIDGLEFFIASGEPESSFHLNLLDSHPNEKYHALVTDLIAPVLLEIVPAD